MVANPNTRLFLFGFKAKDIMEGMLAIMDAKKQKIKSTCFEKWDYHLNSISDIHQKLGTFNW